MLFFGEAISFPGQLLAAIFLLLDFLGHPLLSFPEFLALPLEVE